jgi:hypothetical protein
MTTDNTDRSVLVLGRSQLVLDDAVAGLHELGYTAQATTDFADITGRYDVEHIDMVVFGGQVPPDREAELKHEIGEIKPHIRFVKGLAGIPGLIVNLVQGAFSAEHQDPTEAPTYTPDDRTIRLTVAEPHDLKVTLWWTTSTVPPDPKSDSLILIDDRLAAGAHTLPIPDHIPPKRAYATVQVDTAIYNFSIATEPPSA